MPSLAVIGAGISGLICARTLQDYGLSVTVFEKSRGVGGRMSTRRTDEALHFDHGAQYFTARDARFRGYVNAWQHDGVVAAWLGRIMVLQNGVVIDQKEGTDRFVAVPGMNAICQHMATDLQIEYQTKVAPPRRLRGRWLLASEDGTDWGAYDMVIISAPAPQTAQLLRNVPELAGQADRVEMSGCWAVMLALEESLALPFDAAFIHQSPLSWIARNNSKPNRSPEPETWIMHASPEWSETNLERSAEQVEADLLAEFWRSIGTQPQAIKYIKAHRWRFALPTSPLESRCLFDTSLLIGACGDWCGGPRVEGAFLSGAAAASRVLNLLRPTRVDDSSAT
ncbi:protoporphyrinogen oxidase [Bythopirellula polymerisocia]|uniref:Protoporphyrinogen oxidase n=2 Tax=Bythopirellula polymerisocia TaxID=2528003 RepID=A0A5C6D1D0_9BACT|nr:protoporphyrinogen oxidase [Bythopirellula polymerisocia]